MTEPTVTDLPVEDGTLRVLRFGSGPRIAIAAHGISASGMSFRAVAGQLPAEWSLFALDLRGRGGSSGTPGPYGIDRHAADLCLAAEELGNGGPVALTGHSMGAYIALRAAARRPELFDRLLLVDGGLPLPVPEDADLDGLLDLTLGPAMERLRRMYADDEAYVDFFRMHPALGADWSADIEAYVRYDLTGPQGARCSKAREDAVRQDGRDLLGSTGRCGADLGRLAVPALLVHSPLGLLGQEPPMLPAAVVEHWVERVPQLTAELVERSNHYTILLGTHAKTVAERLAGSWDVA
ncbi:pimeloyl-ACP methyl ester carboxylesterase [Streptomyces sp. SLBN-118]|uniref:alpha/beta fold hydrolase n=1 Tax=Streptomyces sp. SLBN-118 TaxID=2768454 RepID=UPI00114EC026|nr:alpha/beta hydrolase [Streptomyces sp. SLBN-118]TQK50306.1 pimeloyl-ACP methyl ester carboxylesterase [Streptomyces sp. SLBN-118]